MKGERIANTCANEGRAERRSARSTRTGPGERSNDENTNRSTEHDASSYGYWIKLRFFKVLPTIFIKDRSQIPFLLY